eukprot:jgi/Bigna1/83989/fgenesh1_pg.120_\
MTRRKRQRELKSVPQPKAWPSKQQRLKLDRCDASGESIDTVAAFDSSLPSSSSSSSHHSSQLPVLDDSKKVIRPTSENHHSAENNDKHDSTGIAGENRGSSVSDNGDGVGGGDLVREPDRKEKPACKELVTPNDAENGPVSKSYKLSRDSFCRQTSELLSPKTIPKSRARAPPSLARGVTDIAQKDPMLAKVTMNAAAPTTMTTFTMVGSTSLVFITGAISLYTCVAVHALMGRVRAAEDRIRFSLMKLSKKAQAVADADGSCQLPPSTNDASAASEAISQSLLGQPG